MIINKNLYFLKSAYILALFFFAIFVNQYYGFIGVFPIDTFLFYDTSYRVLNGLFPFKDFWSPTSPLIDFIQAFFFKIFGVSWYSYVLHASVFNFIIALGTFYTLEKFKLNIHFCFYYSLLVAALAYPISGVPFNDHHSSILSLLGIFCFILSIYLRSNFLWLFTPIFIGLAFLSKQTPAAYVGMIIFFCSIIHFVFNFELKKILFFILGSLIISTFFFILLNINDIPLKNFYEQYLLFPMSLGDTRVKNFLFPFEFNRIFLRHKLIHISQLVLIIIIIKNIVKDFSYIKKGEFVILLSLVISSLAFILHQLLTLNQIFIFFIIPILLGFSHIFLIKYFKEKRLILYFLIFLGLVSTAYYKINYADNRKFMELENINLKNSIDASSINSKFKGLKWITIFYPNDPKKEIDLINNSIKIINKDQRKKIVATQYQFISSLVDDMTYSPTRTYTPGISYPTTDSDFFIYYKNFFIEQIKKNKIKVIYTIKPYDDYIYDSIIKKDCIKVQSINEILKRHTFIPCDSFEINK